MVVEIPEGVLIGMCNPLLDFQATVGKDFLDKYGLKENDAILADNTHIPLFEELQKNYEVEYIPGGAAQNVLRTFQWIVNQPNRTVFFGAIGNDEYGQKLKEKAISAGVNVHYQINQEVKTGTCAALIYKHHRSLAAHLAAANTFTIDHLDKPENIQAVERAQFYYITGFFITVCPDAIVRVAKHAAEKNKVVMFNISAPFVSEFYGKALEEILPYVDIFFGNEEEVKAYSKCNNLGTEDIKTIAKKISEIQKVNAARPRLVVVTQGPDPVIVVNNGQVEEYPVKQLTEDQIVDTNGAGDAFCGGFVSQYVQNKDLKTCIDVGCYAAREVISQQGCTFPEHCAMSGRVQLSTTLDGVVDYRSLLEEVKDDDLNQSQDQRENSHDESQHSNNMSNIILEQDRFMPIANISRIMKRVLPERAKLSKEAKECIQECVTEFFLFITSEAAEKCNIEKRKTITGEDLLNSMECLGFETYLPVLKLFMKRYREANKAERGMSEEVTMDHEEEMPQSVSVQPPVFTVASPQVPQPRAPMQVYQPSNPLQTKQSEPKQSQTQEKHDLPPNFKRADIFIDTTTMQHYIFVENGYIPIEIRAISNSGQIPQPMPLQSFRNSQN